MKPITCLILTLLGVVIFQMPVKCQVVYPDYQDSVIYVKIQDSSSVSLSMKTPELYAVISGYGISNIVKPFSGINKTLDQTYRISFRNVYRVNALIEDLKKLPFIEYAEKIPLNKITYVPNDLQSNQWNLQKIKAPQAWDFTRGSNTVVIAIVDNAVRTSHHDLQGNIWVNSGEIPGNGFDDDLNGYTDDINGYDVADDDNNPNPPSSVTNSSPFIHGTHTAGIASATTDNGSGIASIGFHVKIMAVKCAHDTSVGNVLSNTDDGIFYAIKAHANIISMSFASNIFSFTTNNMMNTAYVQGIVLVASAGNEGSDSISYPAGYNHVISVGSTDENDIVSSFSNFGSTVDVMAPGSNIWSTLAGDDNAYGNLSGTSMSCPLVAGLAGLVMSYFSGLTPDQVETKIKNGCDNINALNPSYIGKIGAGRINAFRTFSPNGMEEENNPRTAGMIVYPNPGTGKFSITGIKSPVTEIEVYSVLGENVFSLTTQSASQTVIDITNEPAGVYCLRVHNKDGIVSKTIVKH